MIWEILASALVIWGGVMAVIGSLGLLRLPQPMQRLHAPSISTGLAAVMLAVGSGPGGVIVMFLLLTAPISALFLARVQVGTRLAKIRPFGQSDRNNLG